MTPMPWFRVYSEILDDRKIKRVCKKTGHSKALVIGVWICLLALANDAPDRGVLNISDDMPYTIEDIEDETGLPAEILTQLLDEFRSLGMLNGKTTIEITNWSKRQFKSDNVAERVRRHREKRNNETLQERSGIVIDTEEESDTDTEVPHFRSLYDAFLEATKLDELKINQKKAADAIREWMIAGYSPEQVKQAIAEMQAKDYTIVGPWSVTNSIKYVRSKSIPYERPASEVY